ncbi:TRAP transporter substrate-binding protein [Halomarina halobia]|uniref:TRAP transporter substrate-binding protein n=1 Tax=Halomarina halobia TaxID=3033386 RepID=A0ABD6AEH0_9EURY|nr:TRAP transporter substrate-binding protein [Halomarina sp. PSR21]
MAKQGITRSRREALKRIAGAGSVGLVGFSGCIGTEGDGGTNGSSGGKSDATLKFALSGNQQSAHYKGAELLAETVNEKSDGRLQLDVICCQKAGGPPEIAKSVQQGTLDMGLSAVNNLAGLTSAWLFVQLPYLWKDHRNLYSFFNEADVVKQINENAYENLNNIRIKAYWGSNGGSMRHLHLTSNAGLKVPSDASGQKIRVTESPIEKSTVGAWGFSPSPVAWSETVPAMKQGVVDGIHIHYWWLYDSGMYKQIQYTVETATQDSPAVLYVNRGTWDGLSEDLRNVLDESLDEVTPKQIEMDLKQGKTGKQRIKEEHPDIEIYQPSDNEMEEWQRVTSGVYEEWLGKKGVEEEVVKKALEFQDYTPPGVNL